MTEKVIVNLDSGITQRRVLNPVEQTAYDSSLLRRRGEIKPRARRLIRRIARNKRTQLLDANLGNLLEFMLDQALGDAPRITSRDAAGMVRDTLKAIIAEANRLIGLVDAAPNLEEQIVAILNDQRWP